MNREDILTKVEEIFRDLLDEEDYALTENTAPENLSDWDSLFHITLIASVEDEFKIKFATDSIATVKNAGILLEMIAQELSKS